jgi:hypothetical protein
MRFNMTDALQRAMPFLIQQGALIEREVYQIQYRDIQYAELIPVDTSAPEWIKTVTYFSMDGVGAADWFNAKAMDVPKVELLREKFETTVSMAAIGYGYDIEELGTAMMLGMPLTTDKAALARRVAEEMIDRVAMHGETKKGLTGLVNNASVPASAAPNGAAASPLWADKTADEVLLDVNTALTGIVTGTYATEVADTLLIPYDRLLALSTRRIDETNQTTLLNWIKQNNILTQNFGRPLLVRGVFGLETAGAGGTARMVAYRRDPSVVKMHMPMPFRFLPVWQTGPAKFDVPGIFRFGGVDVKRPKSMRYLDEI